MIFKEYPVKSLKVKQIIYVIIVTIALHCTEKKCLIELRLASAGFAPKIIYQKMSLQ